MSSAPAFHQSNSRPQLKCPHCEKVNLKIRHSEQRHPLLKAIWFQCPNLFCGFTGGGNLEITHQISPSAIPNAEVSLMTFKALTERKAANDDNLEEK